MRRLLRVDFVEKWRLMLRRVSSILKDPTRPRIPLESSEAARETSADAHDARPPEAQTSTLVHRDVHDGSCRKRPKPAKKTGDVLYRFSTGTYATSFPSHRQNPMHRPCRFLYRPLPPPFCIDPIHTCASPSVALSTFHRHLLP